MTMRRVPAAILIAVLATRAVAAAAGIDDRAGRAEIAISASVAGQARVTGDAAGLCLWSNTATGLLAVIALDADGISRAPLPGGDPIAATARDCAAGRLTAIALPAAGAGRTILIAPQ